MQQVWQILVIDMHTVLQVPHIECILVELHFFHSLFDCILDLHIEDSPSWLGVKRSSELLELLAFLSFHHCLKFLFYILQLLRINEIIDWTLQI